MHAGDVPATCPTCGEEALTDNARFCVGCGGPLPEVEQPSLRRPAPPPEPPDAVDGPPLTAADAEAPPRDGRPRFAPRPAPSRSEPATELVSAPPMPTRAPKRTPKHRRPRDPTPMVPAAVVILGIGALLALLLILLLME